MCLATCIFMHYMPSYLYLYALCAHLNTYAEYAHTHTGKVGGLFDIYFAPCVAIM